MKIRSVTCFTALDAPLSEEPLRVAGVFAAAARELYSDASFVVQTVRLATSPVNRFIRHADELLAFAGELERVGSAHGLQFKALGALEASARGADLSLLDGLVEVIAATEYVFAAAQIATRREGINLRAVHAAARVMRALADSPRGDMGNFRFAALANVRAGAPFFPAAFAEGQQPSFSIATEAADLAVRAFTAAHNLDHARELLVNSIENAARELSRIAETLAQRFDWRFNGIDFTLAPYHAPEESLGTALERLSRNLFGERMTLFATAFVTDCIRRAHFPRAGFNGVFLPVLEDGTVAARSHANLYSIDSLLLYSTVCGTGLDNVPLPGHISADALAGILLDLASLAVKLDKPLTARLLPIRGAKFGDSTRYEFEWFTNARVMETRGEMTREWAEHNEWIGFAD